MQNQTLVHCQSAAKTALMLGFLLAAAASLAVPNRGGSAMVLGVHPYLSYTEIRVQFDPLAHYLTQHLGIDVKVGVGNSYDDHVEQIGRNRIELAYIGPVGYVKMVNRHGPKPLLAALQTENGKHLTGHFVVRDDSPLRSIADLAGHSVGFGDPNSTMSSVVPTATLQNAGIDVNHLIHQRRYHGHNSIAIGVLSGQVDAGAVKDEVFQRYVSQGLRSLAEFPPVTEHLFLASSDLNPGIIDQIRSLLLGLNQSAEGRRVLRALHPKATALVPVEDSEYDSLRDLISPGN